jgi:N-acetylneuraminate synthase
MVSQHTRLCERIIIKEHRTNLNISPYLIAEAGVNHEGNIDTARRLINEAAEGGADAIKFQTYRAHTLASRNSPAYWDTNQEPASTQFQLFRKYDKFWKKEFENLKLCCDADEIEFLSTPFDLESAVFLNDLMDVFKISSSDITNKPFIEFICDFGKPIILSTGASDIGEIDEAVKWVDSKNVPLALLHCILNYPTSDSNANLGMILGLKKNYPNRMIGYSDHTLPGDMKVLETAALLGAEILEKHFTHDKQLPGNDHYHAMDQDDLLAFRRNMTQLATLIGDAEKRSIPSEAPARRHARRSLVAACNIPKGAKITADLLTWKRPAQGISPKHLYNVVGHIATRAIKRDEILYWEMLN